MDYMQHDSLSDRLEPYDPPSSESSAKVVVSNLQPSVTREDIAELFSDVGPLRRAKMVDHGVAEIVYLRKDDALTAVANYHNRQLDGKPMKCHAFGVKNTPVTNKWMNRSRSELDPELGAIHRALFEERKSAVGNRPLFSLSK